MRPRIYVMSDRRRPWGDSYFVMQGSQIVARGLTWRRAMRIARVLA